MPLSGACSASGRSERTEGMETGAFIEAPQARRSHGLSPDARQAQRTTPSWQASRRLFSPRWPCDDLLALAPHAGAAFSTSLPIMGRLAIPVVAPSIVWPWRTLASGSSKRRHLLKIFLDKRTRFVLAFGRPVRRGTLSRGVAGWDGSGACVRGHANPGLGRPKAGSGVSGDEPDARPRSDRPVLRRGRSFGS